MRSLQYRSREVNNCLSVDVEGFVESNLESFHIEDKYISKSEENSEIRENIHIILELLDELGIKATFFFLGRIGRDIPSLVRETAQHGHEIACHSFTHLRIFGLTQEKFREEITYSKKALEDASGRSVVGFRAPDFSITESSIWALDILKEAGFLYDSSIYPIGLHDVYGISGAVYHIHRLPNGLIEFPLSSVQMFRRRFPFGGGGYFRLYPIILTEYLISKVNELGHPCMLYIHPYEVGSVIPHIDGLSYYRKFRHYYHCKNGSKRLRTLLKAFNFNTSLDILKERGYDLLG
jgi:polysaccharide deacetylase family protein (PEP-CTERM system associated)